MSKINRLLVIALLLQIVILAAVSFAREEPKVLAPSRVFPDLVSDKVTKIEVTGDAGNTGAAADAAPSLKTVVLEKQGTTWGVAGADGYPADATKIDTFLKNVEKVKASGAVVSSESYFKKLEVADDKFQRKVSLTVDGKPVTFLLGSSPSFKRIHLRKAGEKDVVVVEGLTAWDVGFRASDWVDRNYLKVPEADVWAVTLKNTKGTIQLEKSPSGEWAMAGLKAGQTLKKTSVDDVVRKIATVSLEEPLGKTLKPEYGLDAPITTVTMVTGTSTIPGTPPPTTTTETLVIGKKASEGNQYYIKASSKDYVVAAPGWALEPLTTKVVADLLDTPPAAPTPPK